MKRLSICTILTLLSLLCVSCKQSMVKQVSEAKEKLSLPRWLDEQAFGPSPEIIEPDTLFQLNESQILDFEQFASKPANQNKQPNKLVSDYLQAHLNNFNYYSDTFTAKEALIKHQGNCLSLAILTKALAKLNNVEITYQLVETQPVYQKEGNLILSSQHVRTKLLHPKEEAIKGKIVLVRGGLIIDYFPERGSYLLRNVEEQEFFGMYYRNKAAEAIIKKDYNTAYWLLKKTLSINPTDPHGLNMMALIHFYRDHYEIAEKIYLYGIENNKEKMDLMSNYRLLLQRLGRQEEADEIAQQLSKIEDQNPFKWISLANNAYNESAFDDALRYYRKAKKLAPYLHQAYAGIAQSEYQLGDLESAKKEMANALEHAYKKETKSLYQSKINMLSNLLEKNR